MAHLLGLIVMVTVTAALMVIVAYTCITVVLTVLAARRPPPVDLLAEEMDAFLVDLLGPRKPTVGPGSDRSEQTSLPD